MDYEKFDLENLSLQDAISGITDFESSDLIFLEPGTFFTRAKFSISNHCRDSVRYHFFQIRGSVILNYGSGSYLDFFVYIFWRTRMCLPLLCLFRPLCIFERCLDSIPESCRSKQARNQLSHPSPLLSNPSPYVDTHLPT